MSESINAEFVGGPMDGNQRCLPSDVEEIEVFELDKSIVDESGKVKVVKHIYKRRSVESIFTRLPNGFYPFDWKRGEA